MDRETIFKEFFRPEGKFSDLPMIIDAQTMTGSRFGTTPFSQIYLKDLIDFIFEACEKAKLEERGKWQRT